MANASFHAKITADARQFIQQVEQANQALQELTREQKKQGSATGGGSAAKSQEAQKRKQEKVTHDQAEQALNKLHQEEMENINQENQARLSGAKQQRNAIKKARQGDRLQGPARKDVDKGEQQGFKDQAKLITGAQRLTAEQNAQKAAEKQILARKKQQLAETVKIAKAQNALKQKGQQATEKQILARKKQQLAETVKIAKLQKKLIDQGAIRKKELKGQVRSLKDLERIQKQHNDGVKQQKNDAQAVAKANRDQNDAMITGRYALYDMANAYRGIAQSAMRLAQGTLEAVKAFGEFETAFTAVERAATLDVGTQSFMEMREALVDLSREIPVAFDQISEIATLGAQMGVATKDLSQFTETIAKFASVTGNSIDNTAEKFGRLSALANVPTEEFENLASAVVFAGFNAVATEKEILKMSESIVAAAANSGYAGDQVVGLATALSSLGVPPERARGAIQELFSEMNRSVEGTSDKITNFAEIMGLTESSAKSLFKSDPEAFFTQFLSGLEGVENLTVKLDEFGFVNRRTVDVIQRLSGNMDVYDKSIREASEAYAEGTALAEVYADTSDNLESKVERLKNAFEALLATSGEGFGEFLKPMVELLIDATEAAREFAKSGLGQAILPLITIVSAVVAGFAGFKFVVSIATAQLLAMRVAVMKMGQLGGMASRPFMNLTNAIRGNLYVVNQAGMATQYLSKQQIAAQVSTNTLTAETQRQALAMGRASVAARGLSIAMSGLGLLMTGAVVVGIGAMIYEMNRFRIDLSKSGAGVDALSDAIKKDTEIFDESGEAIAAHTLEINTNKNAALSSRDAANVVVDAQGNLAEAFIDTTEQIEAQTIALGENFQRLMVQALVDSEPFQKLYDDAREGGVNVIQLLDEMGLGFEDMIEAAAQDPGFGAVDAVLERVREFTDGLDYDGAQLFGELERIINSPETAQGEKFLASLGLAINDFEGNAREMTPAVRANIDAISQDFNFLATDLEKVAGQSFKVFEGLDTSTGKVLTQLTIEDAFGLIGEGASEAEEDVDDLNKGLGGTAKRLRTVLDYSKDLGGIFKRIMGIEFGELEAEDNIADGWEKIAEKAADAEEAMKEANLEIKELEADQSVLEYQLSVAERYGDEQRAAVIRAKLSKTNEKLADEENKFNEAQTESEKGLEGNSKAARENRDALIGLVGEYGNLIQAAVESGMEGQELEDYIRSLKEEFMEQAEEVGYSRDELVKYSDIFDGFIETVEKVDPRVDIKFDSNISAAEQAFDEYMAKLKSANGYKSTQVMSVKFDQQSLKPIIKDPRVSQAVGDAYRRGEISAMKFYELFYGVDPTTFAQTDMYDTSNMYQGTSTQGLANQGTGTGNLPNIADLPGWSTINEGFATGGYVGEMDDGGRVRGPGGPTSDSIPTMLSNGEYVIQASAVRSYGVDFMNALNQQRLPMAAMPSNASRGSANGSGGNIVYLSPQDRALLRQVADRPVNLYADNGKIAQSANAGNVTISQRGLN